METTKYSSNLSMVAENKLVAFRFENRILCCRCIQGRCKRRACFPVKSKETDIVNHVWNRFNESVPYKSDTHYENRKQIIQESRIRFPESLEFQDNLFLTTKHAIQMLKAKDTKPGKSRRYHRGSARYRAYKLIQSALSEL